MTTIPPNALPWLQPVHTSVPGRVRYRVPALRDPTLDDKALQEAVRRIRGVRRVRINVAAASLLVEFDPGLGRGRMGTTLVTVLSGFDLQTAATPGSGAGPGPAAAGATLLRGLSRGVALLRTSAGPAAEGGLRRFLRGVLEPSAAGTGEAPERPSAAAADRLQWHAMATGEALGELGSGTGGLTQEAAAERLARIGFNTLPEAGRRSELSLLLDQLATPPVLMLGISAAVSVLTGGFADALVIVAVVGLNTAIGFLTERQSERIIASLAPEAPQDVLTFRDGVPRAIPAAELAPGDVVILRPGTQVPADLRLLLAEQMHLDESALTGESMPVSKDATALCQPETPLGDRLNMLYMGTTVTGGSGQGLVVGTGLNTELGHIQSLAAGAEAPQTPVERQLDELGGQLAVLSSVICGGVFVLGVLRGHGWLEMLKASISLAVAAVPEGLPAVATTTLAIGIRNMRRRNVHVRRLDAVETLGSVQSFCLDKTGTLTLNHMRVAAIRSGGEALNLDTDARELLDNDAFRQLCLVACLCSEVELSRDEDGVRLDGSATEVALVELAQDMGMEPAELRRRYPLQRLRHRSQAQPYMVTEHSLPGKRRLLAVKGSPEAVLKLCSHRLTPDGTREALTDETRRAVLLDNERLAGDALRVLAFASAERGGSGGALRGLNWLGLAGMADPLRPGMPELMRRFHRAGIDTTMITGDQSATAFAIARELDLARDGGSLEILDSVNLAQLDPEVLSSLAPEIEVFSRVSPAHKLEIVQALQRGGRIVAMTGDGINDGPALKAADLGVAMGHSGTDVARSVADVVLQDDNLETMTVAIRDGRTIYRNIRKSIRYLLSSNLSEISVMTAGIGLGLGQPLNPMQLLWINLATDIFPSLALAMEPPASDVLEQPPRPRDEPILGRRDLSRLVSESVAMTTGTMASYLIARGRYGPGAQANTHAFMSLVLNQLLHAFSSRSEKFTVLEADKLPPNGYMRVAFLGSVAMQGLTVWLPGMRRLLGTSSMGFSDLLVATGGAVGPFIFNEATKKLRNQADKEP